ncbi:MAG TPA: RcpC/CpaB family pilus assembly protein [Acidimicrobiales bacterium]|nr:RcpC/CpaB family pilus assembly protein [Acidimicrobiales bacterium]
MNKKVVGVIAAVVMAIVGTGALVLFVQGAEDRALEGEELVTVLTAEATIPAGTPAEQLDGLVSEERIPTKIAPEGVVSDLVSLAGLVTAVDLVPGETLLANRFVDPDNFTARRTGSVEVPEGLLEVTLAMSQEQFIGGLPVPGDTVAVVALGDRNEFINPANDPLAAAPVDPANPAAGTQSTLQVAKIILQQALVTNVQGNPLPAQTAEAATDPTQRVAPAAGSLLVTLAMEGPDVERLIYARGAQSLNASLHMARHSGDALVPSTGISVENVINPEAPVG